MVKGIDLLRRPDPDREDEHRARAVQEFIVAFGFALAFAVDRSSDTSTRELENRHVSLFGRGALIRADLEDAFFQRLYVERAERQSIQKSLPGFRPILVYGLPGAGKSTILRRIEKAFDDSEFSFAYSDLKANSNLPIGHSDEDFRAAFRDFVYSWLYDTYVYDRRDSAWRTCYRANDPRYSAVREHLRGLGRTLEDVADEEEWQNLLIAASVVQGFRERFVRPELATLVRFLRKNISLYAICLDNVDRYPISEQQSILSEAIDISNSCDIPVLLAIRDVNLRRIVTEGSNGDFVFYDEVRKLDLTVKRDDAVPLGAVNSDEDQRSLLMKRLSFLQEYVGQHRLDEALAEATAEGMTYEEFSSQFWKLYHAVARTFVDEGLYLMCNHSIRSMMIAAFSLLSNVVLQPSSPFSIDKLLGSRKSVRTTILRTYFYRWLLLNGDVRAGSSLKLTNILELDTESSLRHLSLYVLAFLRSGQSPRRGRQSRIRFSELSAAFAQLGVQEDTLIATLNNLRKPHLCDEQGLVWVSSSQDAISEKDQIEILPSGAFLAERLCTSREYAFLCSLYIPLDETVVREDFTTEALYDDSFKLSVVLRLLTGTLLPDLEAMTPRIRDLASGETAFSPNDWLWRLGVDGELYAQRLCRSVLRSIPYSNLEQADRDKYLTAYTDVSRIADRTVNSLKLSRP